ncbi:MAG: hypothetical protein IID08_01270 [Candidatus Hydrogenedentes bacterium]|nr:hypothetical protein [Candidatus Hydrogenedentota bacterium]
MIRYLVKLLAGCVLTLTITFHSVQALLPTLTPAAPDAIAMKEAQQLRYFSNAILRLESEVIKKAPTPRSRPHEENEFFTWVSRTAAPRAKDLQRRMLAYGTPSTALVALRDAVDRAKVSLTQPEDVQLRRQAANRVLDAVSETEKRIRALGMEQHIAPPPQRPGFKYFR